MNPAQLWAPASFARGFCVLSDFAEIEYLTTGTYNRATESGIRWRDPTIGIDWPVENPILSAKDESAQSLDEWLARPESAHFRYQPSACGRRRGLIRDRSHRGRPRLRAGRAS